jgi:WD40 repeat protein
VRFRLSGNRQALTSAFSPDAKVLLTKADSWLRLWDTSSGRLLWKVKADTDAGDLLFSHDSNLIATKGKESVNLLDAATGKLLRGIGKVEHIDLPLAFSHDGNLLAASGMNGELFLWKTADGELVRRSQAHSNVFFVAAFTPDGTTLVTAGVDRQICRWDVLTGKLRKRFEPDLPELQGIFLSPDGQTLAVIPRTRNRILVWDTNTGKQRFQLGGEKNKVWRFGVFTSDGRALATTSQDQKRGEEVASFWDNETGKMLHSSPMSNRRSGGSFAPAVERFSVTAAERWTSGMLSQVSLA